MRIATVAISALAGLLLATPAFAVTVEAKTSTAFQEKLKDDIGVREEKILTESLTKKVTRIFNERGIKAERVVVTIEDAKPNHPTWEQASSKPGLDPMRSVSVGGAHVTGIAYDASGKEIGRYDYDWYESDLSNVIPAATWSDAQTTFDRFARRFAKELQG
ncbi:MAG: hypothetical protein EOP61_21440 [Sphingomonadales bacterium]|nr:MAG: hypothetical protein EOP61_21440 [Sphingomonadales bacterium]